MAEIWWTGDSIRSDPVNSSSNDNNNNQNGDNSLGSAAAGAAQLGPASTTACSQYAVPAGTLVFFDPEKMQTVSIVVSSPGSYMPDCASTSFSKPDGGAKSDTTEFGGMEPAGFRSSVIPMAYTISVTTVVAWLLLGLVFIAQKPRPWLQKLALLFVATSLTVFLALTTHELKAQYDQGYLDAGELRAAVFGSLAFRVLEVGATAAVWAAHVQVLRRMWGDRPNQKTAITGVGVGMAVLDTVVWALVLFLVFPGHFDHAAYMNGNNGQVQGQGHEKTRLEKVLPPLAYTVQILMQVIYAALVLVYSFQMRWFAYHPRALFIAGLSILCLGLPIAFFVVDIATSPASVSMATAGTATWSEFVRLLSEAAASVVVWEWMDVVDRLQREQQRNGFLGKQIYTRVQGVNFAGGSKRVKRKHLSETADKSGSGSSSDGLTASTFSSENLAAGKTTGMRGSCATRFFSFSGGFGGFWSSTSWAPSPSAVDFTSASAAATATAAPTSEVVAQLQGSGSSTPVSEDPLGFQPGRQPPVLPGPSQEGQRLSPLNPRSQSTTPANTTKTTTPGPGSGIAASISLAPSPLATNTSTTFGSIPQYHHPFRSSLASTNTPSPPPPPSSTSPFFPISPVSPILPSSAHTPPSPSIVQHLHPLRRGSNRNTSPSVPMQSEGLPDLHEHAVYTNSNVYNSPSSNVNGSSQISANNGNAHGTADSDSDSDGDDNEEFRVVQSNGGFEVQTRPPPSMAQGAPPSFSAHPGFDVGDYWDEKASCS